MAHKSDIKKSDETKNLGVLYTGYVDKKNPVTGSFNRRFAVLTHDSFHWFKRAEGYDLFGEERGNTPLGNILTTRILDEDSSIFEIQGTDSQKRFFKCPSQSICEEWVSAIRSSIKGLNSATRRPGMARRSSLSGIRNIFEENEDDNSNTQEVHILLISISTANSRSSEKVITRNPSWDRVITIPKLYKGDKIIIYTSNGGTATVTYETLIEKAESDEQKDFDISIQNVPLASSLNISVFTENNLLTSIENRRRARSISKAEYFIDLIASLTRERTYSINFILSIMVIFVSIASIRAMGANTSLLILLAPLLSFYNLNLIFNRVKEKDFSMSKSHSIRMILHGHHFTSPDEPIKSEEDEIPQRFIDGCEGDLKEARRRWNITKHWRETEGVNNILNEPQPYFHLIKTMYPHYHCGRGREGHVVFYERPGDFEGAQLAARGLKLDDLVRHWLFVTEYQWEILLKGDPLAKSIAVIDAVNFKMTDLSGDKLNYLKKTIGYANAHYPERSYVIYVVNAPFFASMLWKVIRPLVHENTQKKVRILSPKETLKGLQEHIDISQIPELYGGQCDYGGHDSCRWYAPENIELNEFVKRLNEGESSLTKIPFNNSEDQCPPGNPGDIPFEENSSNGNGLTPNGNSPKRPSYNPLNSPPNIKDQSPNPSSLPPTTSPKEQSKFTFSSPATNI